MAASRVSIIICTRDRAESLRETLASIGRCAVPPDLAAELIVVDNASSDGTAAVVHEAGLANLPVRYVLEKTPGLSRARNAGLRAGNGDIFLFTDDDVRVPRDWIAGMCRAIVADGADAVAGGVTFPPEQARALAHEPLCSRRSWFASSEHVDPLKPEHLIGANMAFHRRVAEAVGEFDPALGAGASGFYEETDFCHRLLAAGFRLAAALDTSVEHHFDLDRLTRATLVSIAARMGRSEAYLIHQEQLAQGSGPTVGPAKVWRARTMLLAERLLAPWNLLAGHTTPAELQRVQTLAFCEGMARYGKLEGKTVDTNPRISLMTLLPSDQQPPSPERPRFSVVIPTCRRNGSLAACLDQLTGGRQLLPANDFEVIVSDDAPEGEDAWAMVREKYPTVRWVAGPRCGPAANRNRGVAEARGAWLAFTDDDCVPTPGWLAGYAARLDEPGAPPVRVLEGPTTAAGMENYGPDLHAPLNDKGGLLWSCNFAMERALFDEIGGFDARFPFPHLEDVDLRLRLQDRGEAFPFVPAAVIVHPPRPAQTLPRWARAQESAFYLARKRGVSPAAFGQNTMTYLRMWVQTMRASRNAREKVESSARSLAGFLLVVGYWPFWGWKYRKNR